MFIYIIYIFNKYKILIWIIIEYKSTQSLLFTQREREREKKIRVFYTQKMKKEFQLIKLINLFKRNE